MLKVISYTKKQLNNTPFKKPHHLCILHGLAEGELLAWQCWHWKCRWKSCVLKIAAVSITNVLNIAMDEIRFKEQVLYVSDFVLVLLVCNKMYNSSELQRLQLKSGKPIQLVSTTLAPQTLPNDSLNPLGNSYMDIGRLARVSSWNVRSDTRATWASKSRTTSCPVHHPRTHHQRSFVSYRVCPANNWVTTCVCLVGDLWVTDFVKDCFAIDSHCK